MTPLKIATMIAVIVGMFAMLNPVHAASNTTTVYVFLADYNPETTSYMGVMRNVDGDSVTAIEFALYDENAPAYEDDVQTDSAGWFTATFELEDDQFNGIFRHNDKDFAWRYVNDQNVTISDIRLATQSSMPEALINGYNAQYNGLLVNGTATLLRNAGNPETCQSGCNGYLVQNGNLVRFVRTLDESDNPNGENVHSYKLYLPIVVK